MKGIISRSRGRPARRASQPMSRTMLTVRLPAFRSLPALAMAAIAVVAACALLYYVPQHWHRGEPVQLPFTWVDGVLPFWPMSGLAYFAAFGLLAATFLSLESY